MVTLFYYVFPIFLNYDCFSFFKNGGSITVGQVLECSLAKPQTDQKSFGAQNLQKSAMLPNPTYPPHLGFGMVGAGYGAIGAGFGGAGFAQVRCHFSSLRITNFRMFFADGSVETLAAHDLWSGTNSCRHGDDADAFAGWKDRLRPVSTFFFF